MKSENNPEIKIGKIVQSKLRDILTNIDDEELVLKLCDKKYSKDYFGLSSYAVLVPAVDEAEYNRPYWRYYVDPVWILGKRYVICKEWYERHREKLERWIQEIKSCNSTKVTQSHQA